MILEKFPSIDHTWTLFLDRDGVINKQIIGDYVRTIDDFVFIEGVLPSLKQFAKIFGKIIVVTNQQGVGKNLMTENDLCRIHQYLIDQTLKEGGRIDAIYHAPQLESENSIYRKPNIGMAKLAKKDFPEIDFSKSIMIGDSPSDMDFGHRLNMITILISSQKKNYPFTDYILPSLSKCSDFFSRSI